MQEPPHTSTRSLTGEAVGAGAVVVVDEVNAGGAVETLALAVVEVNVAVLALPTLAAATLVVTLQVDARHGVDARPTLALVGVWRRQRVED